MKKVSTYLLIVVVAGAAFVGYWIYARYVVKPPVQVLSFDVTHGSLQETVTARGTVEAVTSLDLEFPYAGTVISVVKKDGQTVKQGDVLMSLDTKDLVLEKSRLAAVKLQAEAGLDKVLAGSSPEQIRVADEEVARASASFEDAGRTLSDKIRDAYIKADDAIGNETDPFLENPKYSPRFIYDTPDQQAKADVENARKNIETMMDSWRDSIAGITSSNLPTKSAEAQKNIADVSFYLDKIAALINSLTPNQSLIQANLDIYKTNVALGRTNVASAAAALVAGIEKVNAAEASLRVSQREAESVKSPARAEDVEAAKAMIAETASQIAAVEENIRKSVLVAPADGTVAKNWFEKGEFYNPGQPAVSISSSGYQIQSDVSELDIRKVNSTGGEEAIIQLDAYPGETFQGKVVLIEAKPVMKDTDVYYRVTVTFPEDAHQVRIGMSADVTILGEKKENVLKAPELAVYKRGQERYVYVSSDTSGGERVVTTGISDGTDIEITSGLKEGDKVYIKPE